MLLKHHSCLTNTDKIAITQTVRLLYYYLDRTDRVTEPRGICGIIAVPKSTANSRAVLPSKW